MRQRSRPIFYSAALGMLAAWLLACPPKTAVDEVNLAICVLDHSSEPPAQIVTDCQKQGYAVTIDIVTSILAAHRAAEEREASRAKLLDGGRE